ncbi:hypothetical protein [Caballeronia sp. M23-90]
MAIDTAQQVMQLGDYAKRLSAARDRSYALAREVERSRGVLDFMAHDPASDPSLCEYATKALELLCENLVRLCALTDEASANAEALASLPLKYFSNETGTAGELDAAVASLVEATTTAETELVELAQVVAEACEAVDEMRRPEQIG